MMCNKQLDETSLKDQFLRPELTETAVYPIEDSLQNEDDAFICRSTSSYNVLKPLHLSKWDLRLGKRQGKCKRAPREPKQAPLDARMAPPCLLCLALQYARVAQAALKNACLRLKLKKQLLKSKEGNRNFLYQDSDIKLSVFSNAFYI
jgi:hypothetical protein